MHLLLCCTILQTLPENTEVEFIPAAAVVEEEEIEELMVKSQLMLIQERQDRAEKSGQVVSLLDTPARQDYCYCCCRRGRNRNSSVV